MPCHACDQAVQLDSHESDSEPRLHRRIRRTDSVTRTRDLIRETRDPTPYLVRLDEAKSKPSQSKKIYYEQYQLREEGGVGDAGGKREAANTPDQGEGYRATKGRAARGDRGGGQVERQEKEEKAGRSAKYEATCEPKGWEGKGYENPAQDHRKCCEPKEMSWGESKVWHRIRQEKLIFLHCLHHLVYSHFCTYCFLQLKLQF